MPELPQVEALRAWLADRLVGRAVSGVQLVDFAALKTYQPPLDALLGLEITDVARHGKFIDVDAQGVHLVFHFARAGWLTWKDAQPTTPARPGRGPLSLRVTLDDGSGFDLTEAGTQKRLAVWLVDDPAKVPAIAALGPDALDLTVGDLAALLVGNAGRLKTVITDQKVIAGIGNAYSDEILHVAKLSPFATAGKLTESQLAALHDAMVSVLTDAVQRSVGQQAATLKGEKRSGLRVHARTGLPCPVCGDTVREVSFADKSFQYCATCQTGGKVLADRRMSRLLK